MRLRFFFELMLYRGAAICGVLLQSIILVRYFSLDDIGLYYLFATVAYLGNAAIFVGADLNLQRILSKPLIDATVSKNGLLRYVLITCLAGGGALGVVSAIYFYMSTGTAFAPALLCIALSICMYLSALSRNLLQLSNKAKAAALIALIEAAGKAIFMATVAYSGFRHAEGAIFASATGSLIAATIGFFLLRVTFGVPSSEDYIKSKALLAHRIAPVGGAGVLNWAQLQGYRPLISVTAGAEVVGTTSFLTTLGSTAGNAVFSILAQVQIPKLYESGGKTVNEYLRGVLFCTAVTCLGVVPCGAVFLYLTGRMQLLGVSYLLLVGVAIECGNALIGVATNLANVKGFSLWPIPIGTSLGLAVTAGMLCLPHFFSSLFQNIGLALLAGQAMSVAAIYILQKKQTNAASVVSS